MNMEVSPGCESKVTHSVSPLGPQRVSCKRRGTLPSSASPAQTTGERMEETQPCVVDYTYIHSQTQVIYSLSRQPLVSPSYFFCWPAYGRVDRGEHTISWRQNAENWITPGLTSPEQRLAYLHPVLSRGTVQGRRWPCLAPRFGGVSASAAGQHDNLYKALSHTWLTRSRPSQPTFTPAPANYPKTQTDDHIFAFCSLVIFYMLHTHLLCSVLD